MKIDTLILGALQTNSYIVYDAQSGDGIVIDPADEAVFISEILERNNITITAIIATHGHFDHMLAAGELQLMYPHAPFYIHEQDLFLLKNMNSTATHWLKQPSKKVLPQTIQVIKKDTTFHIGKEKLTVIESPGHTPGSICMHSAYKILDTRYSILFSGDTLFNGAVGRTDLSYSSPSDLATSLKKLFKLPENTLVYPGHGEVTTIGNEKI